MAENTKIQWADDTLNLWWGCTKDSTGCKFCYAETLSKRYGKNNWGPQGERTEVKSWRATLAKISRTAKETGQRRKVFVQSMSDIFEGPETMGGIDSRNWEVTDRLRLEFFSQVVPNHPELDFLVLTKRPQYVNRFLNLEPGDELLPNVWMGTSCEDQETADRRIPELLNIPAAIRFLSCEPLLGPIDLNAIQHPEDSEQKIHCFESCAGDPGISWVIAGGESGHGARPMHPHWAIDLRDRCVGNGVPFFFKQWGEYLPWLCFNEAEIQDETEGTKFQTVIWQEEGFEDIGYPIWCDVNDNFGGGAKDLTEDDQLMGKVGKHKAGRLLDGIEWNQFPTVPR